MNERDFALWEQLQQATCQVLSLRDRLLKVAEDLPVEEREQVQGTAERLEAFCVRVREIAKTISVEAKTREEDPEGDDDLRFHLESALEDFEDALEELGEIAEDLKDGAEEAPEAVH